VTLPLLIGEVGSAARVGVHGAARGCVLYGAAQAHAVPALGYGAQQLSRAYGTLALLYEMGLPIIEGHAPIEDPVTAC
jgi:hypothetical protein